MDFPYANIDRLKLIEILQKSTQDDIRLCFGKAVTTIWMPHDVAKELYKKSKE